MSATYGSRLNNYRVLVTATVLLLAIGGAAPTSAAQARHIRIEIHDSFTDDFLTDACGTQVVGAVEASLNVTLISNKAGLIVKEIDPSGGGKVTTSAPETGNSFSFPFNTTIIDFGSGATVGSTFTENFVGVIGHVPGFISSDAGQAVVTGTVEGFDENGSPVLNFAELVAFHGHSNDGDAVVEAMCEALTS